MDYLAGWKSTLKVIGLLWVDDCVVYGLESKKISALTLLVASNAIRTHKNYLAIGSQRPLNLFFDLEGRTVSLLFIRHPSVFFQVATMGRRSARFEYVYLGFGDVGKKKN